MAKDVKVKFLVMREFPKDAAKIMTDVGEKGSFSEQEQAEEACRNLAAKIPADLMGSAPCYWVKKVFTV